MGNKRNARKGNHASGPEGAGEHFTGEHFVAAAVCYSLHTICRPCGLRACRLLNLPLLFLPFIAVSGRFPTLGRAQTAPATAVERAAARGACGQGRWRLPVQVRLAPGCWTVGRSQNKLNTQNALPCTQGVVTPAVQHRGPPSCRAAARVPTAAA